MRLALLGSVAWIASLTEPVFTLLDHAFSWRDLILLSGGLFLVWKATTEIHHHVSRDGEGAGGSGGAVGLTMWAAIGQIVMLDIVFSIDSIVTAIGMTEHVPIMFVAVIVAVAVMLFAAQPLARFIDRNPTIVMLALSFPRDRHDADRRRFRFACAEGLYLRGNGVLGFRRRHEHAGAAREGEALGTDGWPLSRRA